MAFLTKLCNNTRYYTDKTNLIYVPGKCTTADRKHLLEWYGKGPFSLCGGFSHMTAKCSFTWASEKCANQGPTPPPTPAPPTPASPTPGPGPGPSPGPGPAPADCQSQLKADCGPWTSTKTCEKCAEAHGKDLLKAKCTEDEIIALCKIHM